jgi:hypothetical protein
MLIIVANITRSQVELIIIHRPVWSKSPYTSILFMANSCARRLWGLDDPQCHRSCIGMRLGLRYHSPNRSFSGTEQSSEGMGFDYTQRKYRSF